MAAERTQAEAIPEQQVRATARDHDQSWPARQSWFQHGFDHVPCGMVVLSLAPGHPSLYLAANDSFCRLAGYSWAELAGREFLGDFHPDEQAALDAVIQQVISGDCPSIQEPSRLIRKDGGTVAVRVTAATIQPASGERCLSAFVEDLTAAEQAAAEMSQLRHELARSRRMKSLGHLLDGLRAVLHDQGPDPVGRAGPDRRARLRRAGRRPGVAAVRARPRDNGNDRASRRAGIGL